YVRFGALPVSVVTPEPAPKSLQIP
ncbi:MAG: hypothetical protein QOE38_1131, partial [Thermoleophilaceae bacterium]|nr:hypothetical protein [Thermoleophilaceae bacterium]